MPAPLKDAVVEDDYKWLTVFADGRVFRDADVSVDEETFRQMWDGYMCASCYEPLHPAFPEVCTLKGCGFPVAKEQRPFLQATFGGEKWLGPSKEWMERLGHDVWIPPDAKA